eukprot:TRINITY_DN8533_c0_g1_i1.p2 TRINITY_DN8533_c0_g1~~TRINITY_DN8533_c0_g1_i1.p2  ORF type:complete len:117 (-),score=8.84 TRINITY_DN8533_c0_g1_i1:563-913(-)
MDPHVRPFGHQRFVHHLQASANDENVLAAVWREAEDGRTTVGVDLEGFAEAHVSRRAQLRANSATSSSYLTGPFDARITSARAHTPHFRLDGFGPHADPGAFLSRRMSAAAAAAAP